MKRHIRLDNHNALGKKGFALQFNWLFVLIGGAILLGFFISIIVNQASQEQQKTAQESNQELDSVLKVSPSTTDIQKVISLNQPNKEISFSCDETSEYSIEGSFQPSHYEYNAIFSPTTLAGKEVIVQALSFDAPFRIMPVVYVTNKAVEYVFVGNSPILTLLYNALPDNATKKATGSGILSSYDNNNFEQTVFVLADESGLNNLHLSHFTSEKDYKRVYAVVVKPAEEAVNYGELIFYNYTGGRFALVGKAPYFDVSQNMRLALGGVISHDKTIYECTTKKILLRTALLTKLHEQRMLYYMNDAGEYCKPYYETAKGLIETIQQYAEKPNPTIDNFKSLLLAIQDLTNLNAYLITTECPRIY